MKHKHFTFLLALLMSMATSTALAWGIDGDIEVDGLYYNLHGTEAMVTGVRVYGYHTPPIPNPYYGEYPVEAYPVEGEYGLYYYYINWDDYVDWKTITKDDDEWNKYIDEEGNPTTGWGEYDGDDLIEIHVPLLRDEEGNPMDAVDEDGNLLFYEVDDIIEDYDFWNWNNLVRCTFDENGRIKKYVRGYYVDPVFRRPWSYGEWWDEGSSNPWIPSQITYNGVTYTVTGIAFGALEYTGDLGSWIYLDIPNSIK